MTEKQHIKKQQINQQEWKWFATIRDREGNTWVCALMPNQKAASATPGMKHARADHQQPASEAMWLLKKWLELCTGTEHEQGMQRRWFEA